MKFTTSSTRRIGSVLVLHRWSKAATWLVTGPKYLKSFVPPEISIHRMKLFTFFTSAILFYREDWKRFVRFNAARKDVEKVKLWRTGAWLSVEGYSAELYIAARGRDPQNFDKSPPCWMPKIFDEWSILPKQVDCFFRSYRWRGDCFAHVLIWSRAKRT